MKYSEEEKTMWLEEWKNSGIEPMVRESIGLHKRKRDKPTNGIHKGS